MRGNKLGLDYERVTIEHGFSGQIEREPSKGRGNTDLSNTKRAEFEGAREFAQGNERTQSAGFYVLCYKQKECCSLPSLWINEQHSFCL